MVGVIKLKELASEVNTQELNAFLSSRLDEDWCVIRQDVAALIAELEMPWWCQITGYLGRFGQEWAEENNDIIEQNHELAQLITSWARIMPLIKDRAATGTFEKAESVENLRRMLLAMVDDPQVVVLVLCEFLARLRHLDRNSEKAMALAVVVRDVFAPLANRLGMWQIKWELEDLSLRAIDYDSYRRIAKAIDLKREQRLAYLDGVLDILRKEFDEGGIKTNISGRPKHIYSIHKKMTRKDVAIDKIMDMHAVRIICEDVNDCYRALGIVHTLWQPIANQFEDYIAVPKTNGYQSIHTGVIGPEGRIVEIQIRTEEMHEHNELGVAAHWRYKEGIQGGSGIEERILWLRELLKWRDEELNEGEFGGAVSQALSDERVYIFTPKGQVLDLPSGATPLDFAYSVHTQVGNRCRGAKINGRIVPLTQTLATGDQVEILTSKTGGPSRDWLVPSNGYLVTSRARARVQRFFRELDYEQNVQAGRQILEKEMARAGLRGISHDVIQELTRYDDHDDFLEGIARGEIKIKSLVESVARKNKAEVEAPNLQPNTKITPIRKTKTNSPVEIDGLENMVMRMAGCCHPLPGDAILGYLTSTQGISLHRKNCRNMMLMLEQEPERVFAANWSSNIADGLSSVIEVSAYDRKNLVLEITNLIAHSDVRLESIDMKKDERVGTAHVRITIAAANRDEIRNLVKRIELIESIIYCRSG